MGTPRVIRPRFGDLEAASHPHDPVSSGEYVKPRIGPRIEICDRCGLAFTSPMHDPERVRLFTEWLQQRRHR